jgi:hypothetical protein
MFSLSIDVSGNSRLLKISVYITLFLVIFFYFVILNLVGSKKNCNLNCRIILVLVFFRATILVSEHLSNLVIKLKVFPYVFAYVI